MVCTDRNDSLCGVLSVRDWNLNGSGCDRSRRCCEPDTPGRCGKDSKNLVHSYSKCHIAALLPVFLAIIKSIFLR